MSNGNRQAQLLKLLCNQGIFFVTLARNHVQHHIEEAEYV